jgi:MFS family permease
VTEDFLEVHGLVGPSRTKLLSTITAIYDVGCFLGAILAFIIGEKLGRRKSIILGTTVMVIGTVLQASSYSLTQMFIGRVILGLVRRKYHYSACISLTTAQHRKWCQYSYSSSMANRNGTS